MGVGVSALEDKDRVKLDGIVQQMIDNKEPEENIRFVVDDFKTKYSAKKKEPSLPSLPNWLQVSANGGKAGTSGGLLDGIKKGTASVKKSTDTLPETQEDIDYSKMGGGLSSGAPWESPGKRISDKEAEQEAFTRFQYPNPYLNKKETAEQDNTSRIGELEDDPIGNQIKRIEQQKKNVIKNTKDPHDHYALNELKILDKQAELVRDNAIQHSDVAKNVLQDLIAKQGEDLGDIDSRPIEEIAAKTPKTLTGQLLLKRYTDRRVIDQAASTSDNFDDMVFSLSGENKDDIAEARKGQMIDNALSNPVVIEKTKNNADFLQKYRQAKYDLYRNYPSYANKKIGELIGQKLEDESMTGWFYANPGINKVEKAIEMLRKDGVWGNQEDEAFKNIKGQIESGHTSRVIPLTDAVHQGGYGIYEGAEAVDASGRDIINKTVGLGFLDPKGNSIFQNFGLMENNEDRTKRLEQSAAATGHVIPKRAATQFFGGTARFTGQFAPMILGEAMGIPPILNATLQFEGHNADRARELFKNNPGAQNVYTLLGTTFDVFAAKLLPTKKAVEGFQKMMGKEVENVVSGLADKKITEDVARETLLEKAKNYIVGVAGHNTKTAAVLEGYNFVHNGLDAAFGKRKFNLENELQEGVDNYAQNWLNSTFLSGFAAVKGKEQPINKVMFQKIADNPDHYRELISKNTSITPEDKQDRLDKIDHLEAINTMLAKRENLTPEKKAQYLEASMKQFVAQKATKEAPDKLLAKEDEKKVQLAEIEKEHIITPMTNTGMLKKMYDKELLPADAMRALENKESGKFDENKVGEYLKEVAQQSNNLDENWKPHNDNFEVKELPGVPNLIVEAANKHWKKEIAAAEPKPDLGFDTETNQATSEGQPPSSIPVEGKESEHQIAANKIQGLRGEHSKQGKKLESDLDAKLQAAKKRGFKEGEFDAIYSEYKKKYKALLANQESEIYKYSDPVGGDVFLMKGDKNAKQGHHFTSESVLDEILDSNEIVGYMKSDEGYGGVSLTTDKNLDDKGIVLEYGNSSNKNKTTSDQGIRIDFNIERLKQDGYKTKLGNEDLGTFPNEQEVRIIKDNGDGIAATDETTVTDAKKYIDNIQINKKILGEEKTKQTIQKLEEQKIPYTIKGESQKQSNEPIPEATNEKGSKFPKPTVPVNEMNSEQLYEYGKIVREYNKNIEKEFFGEEGAKKYKEARTISNSATADRDKVKEADKVMKDMEDSLTEEQRDEFFGIGFDKNGLYEHQEINDLAGKVRLIEEAENVNDIARSLKLPLLDFSKNKNPSVESLAMLNAAKNKAAELGIEPQELIKESIKNVAKDLNDPNDAVFLAKTILEKLVPTDESKQISNGNIEQTKAENKQGNLSTEEGKQSEIPPPEDTTGAAETEGGEENRVGVRHESLKKIADKMGLKQPERGTFLSPEEQTERGIKLLKGGADPEKIAAEFKEEGKVSPDIISVARAHWMNLVKEAQAAFDAHGKGSKEFIEAKDKMQKWQDEVLKPMGTVSGGSFSALQGENDLDTGSFVAVSNAFKNETGKEPSKEQEKKIKEMTSRNQELEKQAQDLEAKVIDLTDQLLNKTKEKGSSIKDKTKKAADLIRKLKTTRPGTFSSGVPVWDAAVEIVAKAVEAGGSLIDAVAKGVEHIRNSGWHKGLDEEKKNKAIEDFKEALSKSEAELKEEAFEEKVKSGAVKSKMQKPATEQEQIEEDNKELEGLQKQFAGKKDNKFTPDEAKTVWNYAKKNYIDKGVSYRDMIKQVSADLGLSWKQVSEAITSPKMKPISDAMWKKQGEFRRSQNITKRWVDAQSRSVYVRAFLKASAAVRGLQVFGHAGVFMGTHAGMTLAQPRTWKHTVPAFFRAYKFAYGNAAAYEKSLEALKNRPLYTRFERLGLKNNPDQVNTEEFQKSQTALGGWLKKIGMQGLKGFNALKVLRQDLAEYHYNKLTEEQKKDDGAVRSIVRLVNNATGATNLKLPEVINEITFAGGMESARWGKLTRNPMRATAIAIKAMLHPEKATTEEKVFAKVWASRVGEQLATYTSLLFANAAIQSMVNPNNPTNIFNPNKRDWLRPKFGGVTVDPTSGMLSTVDFIHDIAKTPFENSKELHGDTKSQAFGKKLIGRARGKLAPFYSLIYDMVTQTDYNGNQLPLSNIKPDARHRNIGWLEFAAQRLPIPVAEGLHEMFQSAADNGTSPTEAHNVFQALLLAGLSGTTGARASESGKEPPTPFNDEDKKDPTFKYFLGKGMELPNTSLTSEEVKDETTHTKKKISEYPKDVQEKYSTTHKEYLREELKDMKSKGYVFVNPYGDVSISRTHDAKKKTFDELNEKELAQVLHIAQSQATTKSKKKVFNQK